MLQQYLENVPFKWLLYETNFDSVLSVYIKLYMFAWYIFARSFFGHIVSFVNKMPKILNHSIVVTETAKQFVVSDKLEL